MTRGTKSRSLLACALALLLGFAAPAPAGAAEPAAVEEYVLTLPGVDRNDIGGSDALAELGAGTRRYGVTGERREPPTPLAAAAGTLTSPAGLVLLGALLASGGLALRRRGSP